MAPGTGDANASRGRRRADAALSRVSQRGERRDRQRRGQERGDQDPTLAWSSSAPWNAREAISSETVNPTPAESAVPRNSGRLRLSAARFEAAHEAIAMPSGLPMT